VRIALIGSFIIVAAALVISLVFYGQMPATVDSHWDAEGRVNGTMSRFWGTFLLPLMMGGITLLLVFIPRIDPLNPNFKGFQEYYRVFILIFNGFMLLVHTYMILWNTSIIRFKPNFLISIGAGILIYAAGVMVAHARQNWFAGIRTPWTLSSEVVWNKTHHLGGYLFKAAGILIALSVFIPKFSIWIILLASLGVSLTTIVYSFIVYRQEQKAS
jgi:uncharacterized membrane protein